MTAPLQTHLPFSAWSDPALSRLPGIQPLSPDGWITVDEAYAGQMGLRDDLVGSVPDTVIFLAPSAEPAAKELLDMLLSRLAREQGFIVTDTTVTRPDGVVVAIDRAKPMHTSGRLVQEDLCILQPNDAGEHVLTAGAICFPAFWSPAEKFGHPLTRIHVPVPVYDTDVARRVQRLFDGVRPERPLWRANAHLAERPEIVTPAPEGAHPTRAGIDAAYLRSEKQCLVRLPVSDAIVFTIHTYMVRRGDLTALQQQTLTEVMAERIAARQLSSD